MTDNTHRNSLFWPVVLIGAGCILLLRNLGFLPDFSWAALLNLWPVALIVLGLDLMFGRKSPWVGGLIGLLTIGAVIAFLYFSPALGIKAPAEVKTEVISEPLGNTTSVEYFIDTAAQPVSVQALPKSTDLFKATILTPGQVFLSVAGDAHKTVQLSTRSNPNTWLNFINNPQRLYWDIALNPAVPSAINLNGASGALNLDLSGIMLTDLQTTLGSGSSHFILPVTDAPYDVNVQSGSGAVTLNLPENTELALAINSGSGAVTVEIPHSAAVRIEVLSSGSGGVRIPNEYQVVGLNNGAASGSWQSSNFEGAEKSIIIRVVGRGSGSLTFRVK